MQQEPWSLDQLQAGTVAMLFDLRGRVGDVRGDGAALLDEATVKGSPCTSAMVEDAVLTDEFDSVAGTVLFPAFLIPRKPGGSRDGGTWFGSDYLGTRTNHWNSLVRVRPQQQRKKTIHAPASTSDFAA